MATWQMPERHHRVTVWLCPEQTLVTSIKRGSVVEGA
jgi:hypothetical protein